MDFISIIYTSLYIFFGLAVIAVIISYISFKIKKKEEPAKQVEKPKQQLNPELKNMIKKSKEELKKQDERKHKSEPENKNHYQKKKKTRNSGMSTRRVEIINPTKVTQSEPQNDKDNKNKDLPFRYDDDL